MFEVSVSASFVAEHSVTISGVKENAHSHNWNVVATVSGEKLDEDGLVVDFLALQNDLEQVVAALRETNLNCNPVLDDKNPTTEHVAMYIATELTNKVKSPARLLSIKLTEAPNCTATYRL
jgi:6-pyruvoyltetrahydropterin/6-carboxytetrahydropterin synthase|tara:strand:- start:410 stop:772 length:363 start_codon:yes stop_codon:yes gene_type:complete